MQWVSRELIKNNTYTTKLSSARGNRIGMALYRRGLRRGEYAMTWVPCRTTWVPSRANMSDALAKDREKGSPTIALDTKPKKVLFDAPRRNNTQLKGVKRITKTKEDAPMFYVG